MITGEPIIAISAFTLGLMLMGEEGMLLHRVKRWIEKLFTYNVTYEKAVISPVSQTESCTMMQAVTEPRVHWSFKPVWGCPPCMVSIWGTLVFFLGSEAGHWTADVFSFVVSLFGAAFVNALLWKWYQS